MREDAAVGQVPSAHEVFDPVQDDRALGVDELLATMHVLQGRWDKIEEALFNLFRPPQPPNPAANFRYLTYLIATLFHASTDRRIWTCSVARMMEIGADSRIAQERAKAENTAIPPPDTTTRATAPPDPLAMIGDALVRSLTNKVYAEATADALDDWASVWRQVAKQHPDLSLAVRVFGVGLRYVHKHDERVLLDLVREERSILRGLFKLGEGDHIDRSIGSSLDNETILDLRGGATSAELLFDQARESPKSSTSP